MAELSYLFVTSVMLAVFCAPPIMFILAARKRLGWVDPTSVAFPRIKLATYVSGVILVVNLAITVTYSGIVAVDVQALSWVHAVALGLAWLCLWGRLLLGALFRRRDVITQ